MAVVKVLVAVLLLLQALFNLLGHIRNPGAFAKLAHLQATYGNLAGRVLHISSHVLLPLLLAGLLIFKSL